MPDGSVAPRGDAAEVTAFRAGFYACLQRWADACFELTDAVLTAPGPVVSVPSLSVEPVFRRGHGSLYAALARGAVDASAVRDLLVAHYPVDWPLVFAVDASSWARCDAETSPERGFYYHPSRHSAGQPIVAGWSYQWIAGLSPDKDSWTAPVDVARIPPRDDAGGVTAAQVRGVVGRLSPTRDVPLFCFDAGYDPIGLTYDLADTRAQVLTRIRSDRVFYADPPPRPNRPASTGGRPPRHGARFACADPVTWPAPDDELTTGDGQYGHVHVAAWRGLHPKLERRAHGRWAAHDQPPIVSGTIIRVQVEHLPKPTSRTTKTLWLWHAGPAAPDLDVCWRAYIRRFDIEHTFRFCKNTLGWTTPGVCTPQQADRWSQIIAVAYTQLRLARPLVADQRLPWERRLDPHRLTPTRVRRGFHRLRATLDTPARTAKPSRPGPGRPKGSGQGRRTRHPAIKKAA